MARKRQRKEELKEDHPALRDYNAAVDAKRPRYDLRTGQVRECCSLPQYDKQPCPHKYHLRPFDHRKPSNYFASKSKLGISSTTTTSSSGKKEGRNHTSKGISAAVKRNAHSYSINGHLARCSNSSTASGRQRALQALKKGTSKGGSHKVKEEVS